MYINELIGEMLFAKNLGEAMALTGRERSTWIARRLLARLPCQQGAEICGGFRVTPRGAVPCGCVRLRSELVPLFESGLWPLAILRSQLKPGSIVKTPKLAWTITSSEEELAHSVDSLISFLLRIIDSQLVVKGPPSASVSVHDRDAQSLTVSIIERLLLVQSIFFSEYHATFLWPEVLATLTRASDRFFEIGKFGVFEGLIQARRVVVLDFGDSKLAAASTTRPQSENTVRAFEFFLDAVFRADAGLVVFSKQGLMPAGGSSAGYKPDFSAPLQRTRRDANNKLRFESTKSLSRTAVSIQDVLSQGAWDRLLELLARGQSAIDSLEAVTV